MQERELKAPEQNCADKDKKVIKDVQIGRYTDKQVCMIETKLTNEQMSNLSINTENKQDSSLAKLRLFSTLGVFRPDTNNREGEQTLMKRKKKKLRRGGKI